MLIEPTPESTPLAAVRPAGMIPPDAGFELRHLRYFVTVAEHLHFGRAAKALNISQPPLSRQIQDLEYQVGIQLLRRWPRPVALTPAGQVFLAESKRILSQVHQSLETLRSAKGVTSNLHVGYSALLQDALLPTIRAAVADEVPQATFRFQLLDSEEQIRMIRDETLDAGLILLPIENADQIRIEQLFRVPAVVLVATSHPFSKCPRISLREVASSTIVEVGEAFAARGCRPVEHIARLCGPAMEVQRYAPDLERLFEEVRQNGSVAILPRCAQPLAGSGIRCVPIVEREADFTFAVAHRRDRGDSLLEIFLQALRQVRLQQSRPH